MNQYYVNLMSNVNKQIQSLSNIYLQTIKLLYTNLAPTGYVDYFLDSINLDLSEFPPLFSFYTFTTQNEVNSLVNFYSQQVQNFINYIRSIGYEIALENKIYQSKQSLVNVINVSKSLLNEQLSDLYEYTLPFNMSLRMALYLNNINFNNISNVTYVLSLNRTAINSTNFIPAGTVLQLPKIKNA